MTEKLPIPTPDCDFSDIGASAAMGTSCLSGMVSVRDKTTTRKPAMATTTTAVKKSSPASAKKIPAKSPTAAKRQKDACDLLDADHKAVKAMFKEYGTLTESRSRSTAKKRQLADQICKEVAVHATIEEEIFYPAARKAIKDNALMNEATVEHASAKDLIAQIKGMDASDEMFDAKVTVLGEYIDHHVKEERNQIFPRVRKTKLDLMKLGEQLQLRKKALLADHEAADLKPVREVATAL